MPSTCPDKQRTMSPSSRVQLALQRYSKLLPAGLEFVFVHADVQCQAEELGKVLSQMKLILQGTQGSSNVDTPRSTLILTVRQRQRLAQTRCTSW